MPSPERFVMRFAGLTAASAVGASALRSERRASSADVSNSVEVGVGHALCGPAAEHAAGIGGAWWLGGRRFWTSQPAGGAEPRLPSGHVATSLSGALPRFVWPNGTGP